MATTTASSAVAGDVDEAKTPAAWRAVKLKKVPPGDSKRNISIPTTPLLTADNSHSTKQDGCSATTAPSTGTARSSTKPSAGEASKTGRSQTIESGQCEPYIEAARRLRKVPKPADFLDSPAKGKAKSIPDGDNPAPTLKINALIRKFDAPKAPPANQQKHADKATPLSKQKSPTAEHGDEMDPSKLYEYVRARLRPVKKSPGASQESANQ